MNKKEYDIEYARTKLKRIAFNLHKEIDKDIISHLEKKKPVQAYLKSLIRKDMKGE